MKNWLSAFGSFLAFQKGFFIYSAIAGAALGCLKFLFFKGLSWWFVWLVFALPINIALIVLPTMYLYLMLVLLIGWIKGTPSKE